MNQESIQLVLNYLDKVAAKIGTTAEHLWPILIRQQYAEAFVPLAVLLLSIPSIIWLALHTDWEEESASTVVRAVSVGALGLIIFGAALPFFIEFGDIFNPQYHALRDLLRMAR